MKMRVQRTVNLHMSSEGSSSQPRSGEGEDRGERGAKGDEVQLTREVQIVGASIVEIGCV